MTQVEYQNKIFSLPNEMQDFVLSFDRADDNIKIFKKFKLDEKQKQVIHTLILRIWIKDLDFRKLNIEIKKDLELEDKFSKELTIELCKYHFLPLSEFLGQVSEYIESLGESIKDFKYKKIKKRRISFQKASLEILKESALKFDMERLEKRFLNIVELNLKNTINNKRTKEILMRVHKVGGLLMQEKNADIVLQTIKKKKSEVVFIKEISKEEAVNEDEQDRKIINDYVLEMSEKNVLEALKNQIKEKITNTQDIYNILYKELVSEKIDKDKIVSLLSILAEEKSLIPVFQNSEQLKNLFLTSLKSKKRSFYKIEMFKKDNKNIKFLIMFLKFIFEEKLKMTENEAARLGMQLGNIIRKRENKKDFYFTYYDLKNQSFKWN